MNVTKMICIILGALSALSGVTSRAIRSMDFFSQEEEQQHKISKRATADHRLVDQFGRSRVTNERRYILAHLMGGIDTSGQDYESSDNALSQTSVTEVSGSSSSGHGSGGRKHRRRKGRGRKGKGKRRRNRGGRHRKNKNKRQRHRRDLYEVVKDLLVSEDGEQVLRAIAGAVSSDRVDTVEEATRIIKSTEKKCECRNKKTSGD